MGDNTLELLTDVVQALEDAGIQTWLFGGWAEELLGLRAPGPHHDIDLLYPAQSFSLLDEFLRTQSSAEEVLLKRFSHKRAFEWHGVLVEVFLVRSEADRLVTDFFEAFQFVWPPETLSHSVRLLERECPAASTEALRLYRMKHGEVTRAYWRHQGLLTAE